jgi:hypothetical protein
LNNGTAPAQKGSLLYISLSPTVDFLYVCLSLRKTC